MILISWNVNGIRAALKKGFDLFLAESNADIVCVQETKAQPEQVTIAQNGYSDYWNSAQRKGYSGTATFTKTSPVSVQYGIGIEEHDTEGRALTLEFPKFYLVNVYTPNSKRGLERLPYRQEWDLAFLAFLNNLREKKGVIFCGDLNVAHKEIDLARPKTNMKNSGFTPEERAGFDRFLAHDYIDTFREFTKEGDHYSWWNVMTKARDRNVGWRIDYFCISSDLRPYLKNAWIMPDVMGSDHCPVAIELSDDVLS